MLLEKRDIMSCFQATFVIASEAWQSHTIKEIASPLGVRNDI